MHSLLLFFAQVDCFPFFLWIVPGHGKDAAAGTVDCCFFPTCSWCQLTCSSLLKIFRFQKAAGGNDVVRNVDTRMFLALQKLEVTIPFFSRN